MGPQFEGKELIDIIFRWFIDDVINDQLCKNKVVPIPDTFDSLTDYLSSFKYPLVKETYRNLQKSIRAVSGGKKAWEISKLNWDEDETDGAYYTLQLKIREGEMSHEIETGDLILITSKPNFQDVDKSDMFYAYVLDKDERSISVTSSRPNIKERMFVVRLLNLTTNLRIWVALYRDMNRGDVKVMNSLLKVIPKVEEENCSCERETLKNDIRKCIPDIDPSQEDAIVNCIFNLNCPHNQSCLSLIWGPPGTGKTRTIASLLRVLSCTTKECRTLICAPTNVAIVGVAKRFLTLMQCGWGDIVIYGNGKRMKIDDHAELHKVFLDHRVSALDQGFRSQSGWRESLNTIRLLLKDPKSHCKQPGSFKEILLEQFDDMEKEVLKFLGCLTEHLPTKFMTVETVRKRRVVRKLIKDLRRSIEKLEHESLELAFSERKLKANKKLDKIHITTAGLIEALESVKVSISSINFINRDTIRQFCMENAKYIFCTASSSSKLLSREGIKVDLLIIDEAAQLKECESCIPFQLPGLRHAILVGDEKQLPAMVEDKCCKEGNFGRSLFERLVMLGHRKLLLDHQYRMHPSISLFPNKTFYHNQIKDGANVLSPDYAREFLKGGVREYAFYNVGIWNNEKAIGTGWISPWEIKVIAEFLPRVYEEYCSAKKQKLHITILSPYKEQVSRIREALGKKCSNSSSDFKVEASTIDGFQGSEADIIIFSPVRSNMNGQIGFLADKQRTNVALTRARHCLWIFGDAHTLRKSDSIWTEIVNDAMERDCYFDDNLFPSATGDILEH